MLNGVSFSYDIAYPTQMPNLKKLVYFILAPI